MQALKLVLVNVNFYTKLNRINNQSNFVCTFRSLVSCRGRCKWKCCCLSSNRNRCGNRTSLSWSKCGLRSPGALVSLFCRRCLFLGTLRNLFTWIEEVSLKLQRSYFAGVCKIKIRFYFAFKVNFNVKNNLGIFLTFKTTFI